MKQISDLRDLRTDISQMIGLIEASKRRFEKILNVESSYHDKAMNDLEMALLEVEGLLRSFLREEGEK